MVLFLVIEMIVLFVVFDPGVRASKLLQTQFINPR